MKSLPHWFDLSSTTSPELWRALLRRIKVAGPFVPTGGLPAMRVTEQNETTLISPEDVDLAPRVTILGTGRASIVARPPAVAHACVVGRDARLFREVRAPGRRGEVLMRDRFRGVNVALAGTDEPWLLMGFSVSNQLSAIGDGEGLAGIGVVASMLKWFLDVRADPVGFRFGAWPDGGGVTMFSFDVEEDVPQRSVGRTVVSLPAGAKDVFRLSSLATWRPIRGRRIIRSTAKLDVGGQTVPHRRWTIDVRRGAKGMAPENPWATQFQLGFGLRRRLAPVSSDYASFQAMCARRFPESTLYICGGSSGAYCDDATQVGFHGQRHDHFNGLGSDALEQELRAGAQCLAGRTCRPIRAPGLNWSPAYLNALASHGYTSDSSVRDFAAEYPLVPWKTTQGVWLLPVNGPITRTGVGEKMLAHARAGAHYLCLYAHDHDPRDEAGREHLAAQLEQLRTQGLPPRSATWCEAALERSLTDEILSVESRSEGRWSVGVRRAPGIEVFQRGAGPSSVVVTDSRVNQGLL